MMKGREILEESRRNRCFWPLFVAAPALFIDGNVACACRLARSCLEFAEFSFFLAESTNIIDA